MNAASQRSSAQPSVTDRVDLAGEEGLAVVFGV